jgi:hypothetical protein
MSEVLFERGIGATRALVIEDGVVVEAHFERDDSPRFGAVHVARLSTILEPGRRGIMRIGDNEGLIEPLPYCPEGGLLRVEVMREAIHETGRPRLAKLRNVEGDTTTEGQVSAGVDLAARLKVAGHSLTHLGSHGEDRLEAAGWSETVESARTGHFAFPGGLLTISPTPAMTVIDVDGPGDIEALAQASAVAVAAAIRVFDLQGSLGVDFPTLEGKAARARLGEILDEHLPAPFERTAVNGWGFVQIVRPRRRANFIEQVRAPGFAALELLRRAGRGAAGGRMLVAHPVVIAWLAARPALTEALGRATGGEVRLQEDAGLAISGGDVHH